MLRACVLERIKGARELAELVDSPDVELRDISPSDAYPSSISPTQASVQLRWLKGLGIVSSR